MVSYLFLFQCNHLIPCYFFYRISVFIRFFFYPSLSSFILSLHWNCFFSLLLPCFFCIFLHSPSKLKDKYLLSLWLSTRSSSYCHLQIKKVYCTLARSLILTASQIFCRRCCKWMQFTSTGYRNYLSIGICLLWKIPFVQFSYQRQSKTLKIFPYLGRPPFLFLASCYFIF